MNLQQANFEDLLAAYYQRTSAHEAAERLGALIQDRRHTQLATLLRDYRGRAITSPEEIHLRAATDRLMNCCSVLEVASLAGFIPAHWNTDFAAQISPILQNEHVRRYYEEFYPTKLPQLLRYRLTGPNHSIEDLRPLGSSKFMSFLDLDRRFMEKLDDGYLLRMLDSFTIGGYRFDDVVDIIGEPQKFIDHLLRSREKRDARSKALYEFSLFMQFCFDFRELLAQLDEHALVQSAMWNHYSYWFDIIGDNLRDQLGVALSRFLEWKPVGEVKGAAESVQTYVREAGDVLNDLTSRKFAGPLDDLLHRFRLTPKNPDQSAKRD